MLIVYRAEMGARSISFGIGIRCKTWREANLHRESIAKAASLSKTTTTTPIVYDEQGNFVVEGWIKGY